MQSAELYDQALDKWTPAGTTATAHAGGCEVALLPSGNVIVASGYTIAGNPSRNHERRQRAPTPSPMLGHQRRRCRTPAANFALVTLPVGKVLATGGSFALGTAQLFDEAAAIQHDGQGRGGRGSCWPRCFSTARRLVGPEGASGISGAAGSGLSARRAHRPPTATAAFARTACAATRPASANARRATFRARPARARRVTGPRGRPQSLHDKDGTACGGTCNGTTTSACTYPAGATECRPASCTAGVAAVAANCVGTGKCPAMTTQSCGAYACQGTACGTTCATDGDCANTHYCSGRLVAKEPQVDPCSAANICTVRPLHRRRCARPHADGRCEACDGAGYCAAVKGDPVGVAKSIRSACTTDGSKCGGTCDGKSVARRAHIRAEHAVSRSGAVRTTSGTLAGHCDGSGTCPAVETQNCTPLHCSPTAPSCASNCGTDAACQSGNYCDLGMSRAARPRAGCTKTSMCKSGN